MYKMQIVGRVVYATLGFMVAVVLFTHGVI